MASDRAEDAETPRSRGCERIDLERRQRAAMRVIRALVRRASSGARPCRGGAIRVRVGDPHRHPLEERLQAISEIWIYDDGDGLHPLKVERNPMDIATIGLSVVLVTTNCSGPEQPQPPLRMPATRGTRGALVALGVVVGAYAGAYMGEGFGENGWGVGLPLGAVAGGVLAFLATK